jgi:hypothetical protein
VRVARDRAQQAAVEHLDLVHVEVVGLLSDEGLEVFLRAGEVSGLHAHEGALEALLRGLGLQAHDEVEVGQGLLGVLGEVDEVVQQTQDHGSRSGGLKMIGFDEKPP